MTKQDWQALLREASQLRGAGRIEEACAAYKRLLAAKPDLPDSWFNLGLLQRQSRAFDDSLESYQRAIDLGVSGPEEAHLNRAVILSDHLHRPEDAESELNAALARNPDYVPALLNLGNLLEDLGRRDEARKAYVRALDVDPGNSLALARLATVSLPAEPDMAMKERLDAAIANPRTTPAEAADMGFALGALLDAASDHDLAFEAYSAANRASRAAAGPAATYDRGAHERLIDRLIATFDRPATSAGDEAHSPIFICGLFRSGSTLVEQILASHGQVSAGGELDLIPLLAGRIHGYPEAVAKADPETLREWRRAYLEALPVQPGKDLRVTDKRPDNFLHIGLIKAIFPNARIIHTRRDPLDNLLSLYFLHLDPGMAYALDLEDAAHWYRQYERLMAHWKKLYPGDIFDLSYDELVRNPRPVIETLVDFCGLGSDGRVLDFHRNPSAVKTASVWQVREPLYARSSGRWHNYARHLEAIKKLLESSAD